MCFVLSSAFTLRNGFTVFSVYLNELTRCHTGEVSVKGAFTHMKMFREPVKQDLFSFKIKL